MQSAVSVMLSHPSQRSTVHTTSTDIRLISIHLFSSLSKNRRTNEPTNRRTVGILEPKTLQRTNERPTNERTNERTINGDKDDNNDDDDDHCHSQSLTPISNRHRRKSFLWVITFMFTVTPYMRNVIYVLSIHSLHFCTKTKLKIETQKAYFIQNVTEPPKRGTRFIIAVNSGNSNQVRAVPKVQNTCLRLQRANYSSNQFD